VFAYPPNPIVGRAHKGANALTEGSVQHSEHGFDIAEAKRLSAGTLLGHVVDAEELVVAQQ
jgi:hypothetical protein